MNKETFINCRNIWARWSIKFELIVMHFFRQHHWPNHLLRNLKLIPVTHLQCLRICRRKLDRSIWVVRLSDLQIFHFNLSSWQLAVSSRGNSTFRGCYVRCFRSLVTLPDKKLSPSPKTNKQTNKNLSLLFCLFSK